MGFVRDDAVKFADKYWNTPADDGLFWLSNEAVVIEQVRKSNVIPTSFWQKAPAADGWQPFFVDDSNGGEKAVFRRAVGGRTEEILINPWEGIADCAHFLSRCLSAGGLKIAERGVPSLVNTLQSLPNTKTLAERVDTGTGQQVINAGIFKPGDMIGYFNIDPQGDYGGLRQYSHSGMYVGKIGGSKDGAITCHTICRFPGRSWVEDSWWLKPPGHYAYTLIHFSDDDPLPDPAKVSALSGWWKRSLGSNIDYFLIERSGAAHRTTKPPARGQTVAIAPTGSAYWYLGPSNTVMLFWRGAGLEVWAPDGAGYKSVTNGIIAGTVTKF